MEHSTIFLSVDSQAIVRQIIQREIVLFGKPNEQSELSEYPYPWIYKPKFREERMKLQSSVFMLWGSLRLSFDKIVKSDDYMELSVDSDNKTNENGTLCAIAVPADAKSKILQQLNDIGINEKFIFPGLDGVGKTIAEKYSAK